MKFIQLTKGDEPRWINMDLVTEIAPSTKGSLLYFAAGVSSSVTKDSFIAQSRTVVKEKPQQILELLKN